MTPAERERIAAADRRRLAARALWAGHRAALRDAPDPRSVRPRAPAALAGVLADLWPAAAGERDTLDERAFLALAAAVVDLLRDEGYRLEPDL